MPIASSELILRADGSIYHLGLQPSQIASDIITVGDPDRIDAVVKHLDHVEFDQQMREFRTVTGHRRGKRWTIVSTGIGTDNIDIVFNELDALANVNFATRTANPVHRKLRFYRLGTSGTLREDIAIDSMVVSKYAVDLGVLGQYYQYESSAPAIADATSVLLADEKIHVLCKAATGSASLIHLLPARYIRGITFTAPGFYAPQGRSIRLAARSPDYLSRLAALTHETIPATNLEMETAGIYILAELLGHQAVSISAILANRRLGTFSTAPQEVVARMIADFFEVYS